MRRMSTPSAGVEAKLLRVERFAVQRVSPLAQCVLERVEERTSGSEDDAQEDFRGVGLQWSGLIWAAACGGLAVEVAYDPAGIEAARNGATRYAR